MSKIDERTTSHHLYHSTRTAVLCPHCRNEREKLLRLGIIKNFFVFMYKRRKGRK
ncbi:hypothetical protein I656_00944 [Geobacillus sp. WSUCF1]|nr:hypothetical protein I656_00944 [Geobacillus sp. WSUCF1]